VISMMMVVNRGLLIGRGGTTSSSRAMMMRSVSSGFSDAPDEWIEELRIRFKLELVEDEEELAGASDDRVRENFRAMMRTMDLQSDEDGWMALARYFVCLVLDGAAVEMLARLQFADKVPHRTLDRRDCLDEWRTFSKMIVKAIDANWDREDERGPYRGFGQLWIHGLQDLYLRITSDACKKAMEDLLRIDGWPGDKMQGW
jgi:hypothetical protein